MTYKRVKTTTEKTLGNPIVAVIIIPLLISAGFYLGAWYQGEQYQQQINNELHRIDCRDAQYMANSVNTHSNTTGQHATFSSNPDGSCNLFYQFNLTVSATMHVSACVNITISRANGTTTQNGCSTTAT